MLSLLYLVVKAQQYFVTSSCMFFDEKTVLDIFLKPRLNLTIFLGTGPCYMVHDHWSVWKYPKEKETGGRVAYKLTNRPISNKFYSYLAFIYCPLTVAIFITYSQNSNLPFIISSSRAPRGSKNGATPTRFSLGIQPGGSNKVPWEITSRL